MKICHIYRLNNKILLTILCLSGFELYSRWVPLHLRRKAKGPLRNVSWKEKQSPVLKARMVVYTADTEIVDGQHKLLNGFHVPLKR